MQVVNPQAAGIDVGSRSHWAATGQSEGDVREYGVFNEDLFAMADWLKETPRTSRGKRQMSKTANESSNSIAWGCSPVVFCPMRKPNNCGPIAGSEPICFIQGRPRPKRCK